MEILIICLVFSVLLNIVQAISGEFQKGYNIGMNFASEFEERLDLLEVRASECDNERCKIGRAHV